VPTGRERGKSQFGIYSFTDVRQAFMTGKVGVVNDLAVHNPLRWPDRTSRFRKGTSQSTCERKLGFGKSLTEASLGRCSYERGRRGGRRFYGPGDGEGGDEGLSVEEVVRILQQLPKGQPVPEHVSTSTSNTADVCDSDIDC